MIKWSISNDKTSEEKHQARDLSFDIDINDLLHACLLPSNISLSPTDLSGLIFYIFI